MVWVRTPLLPHMTLFSPYTTSIMFMNNYLLIYANHHYQHHLQNTKNYFSQQFDQSLGGVAEPTGYCLQYGSITLVIIMHRTANLFYPPKPKLEIAQVWKFTHVCIVLTLVGDQKYFYNPPSNGTSSIKEVKSTGFMLHDKSSQP